MVKSLEQGINLCEIDPTDLNESLEQGINLCEIDPTDLNLSLTKDISQPDRMPKLRSATGHELRMLGKIKITLHMGK